MTTADMLCSMGWSGAAVAALAFGVAFVAGCDGHNKTAVAFVLLGLIGAGSCGASLHPCEVAKAEARCSE